MVGLMQLETDGPFFRMGWAEGLWDDEEKTHVTPVVPITRCYNEVLLPLAAERGENLTEEDLLRAVAGKTAVDLFPSGTVDWLGLALYAEHRFRQAMGKLSMANNSEHQAEIRAANPLWWRLGDLYVHLCWESASKCDSKTAQVRAESFPASPSQTRQGTECDSADTPR